MNKLKILKEVAWIIGLTLFALGMVIFGDRWFDNNDVVYFIVHLLTPMLISGITRLIWSLICHQFFIYPMIYFEWVMVISVFFNIVILRILFHFFISKLKWRFVAGFLVLIVFVLTNYGVENLSMRINLKPHWRTYQFNDYHFSIDSPYPLIIGANRSTGMDEYGKFRQKKRLDTYDIFRLINTSVDFVEYESFFSPFGRDDKEKGTEKVSVTACSGYPATLINNQDEQYLRMEVFKKPYRWTFRAGYKNFWSDEYSEDTQKMADRVIRSIKITNLPISILNSLDSLADYEWKCRTLDGKNFDMARLKGKVVFLNFWATWCPPCVAEMPSIEKLYKKFKNSQIVFLCVSEENIKTVQQFAARKKISAPIYVLNGKLPEIFKTYAIPATFIISPKGKIVLGHIGREDWNDVKNIRLLKRVATEGSSS